PRRRERARRVDGARRPALAAMLFLLRTAVAPRTRLWSAQGHPRHPGRRGRAHAYRNLTAVAAHTRLDEGLSLLARIDRPGHVAGKALQLRRSAVASVGAAALPTHRTDRGRSRARSSPLRAAQTAPAA